MPHPFVSRHSRILQQKLFGKRLFLIFLLSLFTFFYFLILQIPRIHVPFHWSRSEADSWIALQNQMNLPESVSSTCDNLWNYGAETNFTGVPEWKPFGCQLASYRNQSGLDKLKECAMKYPTQHSKTGISVLFIGDSRLRQLQVALYRELRGLGVKENTLQWMGPEDYCDLPETENIASYLENRDFMQACEFSRTVEEYNFSIARWWVPYVEKKFLENKMGYLLALSDEDTPALILINSGLWLIRIPCGYEKLPFEDCYHRYLNGIADLKADLIELTKRSTVVWVLQNHLNPCDTWYFWQANTRISIFNDVAIDILRDTDVKIWRSYYQIFDLLAEPTGDPQHMTEGHLQLETQILLNFLCNSVVQADPGVCCVASGGEGPKHTR